MIQKSNDPMTATKESAMDKTAELFMNGRIHDPFMVLGAHAQRLGENSGTVYRAYIPGAQEVAALLAEGELELKKVHPAGLFEAFQAGPHDFKPYRLRADFGSGNVSTFYDAYSFAPVISEYDLFLCWCRCRCKHR